MFVEQMFEHEDGSASFRIDCTREETKLLLIFAVKAAILNGLKEAKEWKDDSEVDLGNT
jgi:hypothetical protein